MNDELLPYYERELAAIRKLAGEFAAANPSAARHLRLTADKVDDPHVGRLLEGLAFIAARVHRRLDECLQMLVQLHRPGIRVHVGRIGRCHISVIYVDHGLEWNG